MGVGGGVHGRLVRGVDRQTWWIHRVAELGTDREIRLIGYDLLEENLRHLKSGTIDFLIHQNPKRQAFLSISHLVNHLMFKKSTPQQELFPLEVITEQNLGSYLNSGLH